VKCQGTSGPRFAATQRAASPISSSEGVEHGRETRAADLLVEVVPEGLEVDVGSVDRTEEVGAGAGIHPACGHRHRADPALATGLGGVDRVLQEDDRIVVGKRNTPAAAGDRRLGDLRRQRRIRQRIDLAALADVPVLAETAGEIAARGAKGEDGRAGQEVAQRLLLDGIDAVTAGAPPAGEKQLVALAGAHEAQAALAVGQPAVARTDVTLQLAALDRVPVPGGHRSGLRPDLSCIHETSIDPEAAASRAELTSASLGRYW
jgi:hypothetical protein